MAIKLGDFVSHLKRTGQYGQVAVTSDTPTTDILASINKRLVAIWGRAAWKWSVEPLRFALAPQTREYTVTAISGNAFDKIINLIPYDSTDTFLQGEPLSNRTERDFYAHCAAPRTWEQAGGVSPGYNVGFPTDYYIKSQDSSGRWVIVVDPVPSAVAYIGGTAKKILTTYAVSDITANTDILYFPNAVVWDALFAGCMIDIGLIKGMPIENSFALEKGFEAKISRLVEDQIGVTSDNTPPTTRLPPTVNRLRANLRRRR